MAFANPEGNVEQLGQIDAMKVADFGAGVGAYTIPLAKSVGDFGRVYAIEVQKDLLPKIKNIAIEQNLTNVEVLWGDIERVGATKLSDKSIDIVVVANVIFAVEDKLGLVNEAHRVLVPKGKVLLVDWRDSYGGLGPQPDRIVSPEDARQYFEKAGFVYEKSIQTGDQHYGFIMSKD
ncbi:MAG: methyltransferase domain-containing protein [Candidatus Pacebacteria bacterium]|nr:methyltransferase domain-containing protein [Candidatus Paceibacterota bacterium]